MKWLVCARHLLALEWAEKQNLAKGTFKTATEARTLRGQPRDSEIIVIDSGLRMHDSAALEQLIAIRFTNVTRIRLP